MTIFDHIKYLFFKNRLTEELNDDNIQAFIPYMLTRWLSFYDKQHASLANEIFNKYSSVFSDKYDCYNFFNNVISKMSYKKIVYVKKQKKDSKEINHIGLVAQNMGISTRELKQYIDLNNQLCK